MSYNENHTVSISRVKNLLKILKQRLENGTLNNNNDLREIAEDALLQKNARRNKSWASKQL